MKTPRSVWIAVVLGLGLAFGLGRWTAPEVAGDGLEGNDSGHDHSDGEWTCSMHPEVRQSEPGSCPLCGMDLIPATEGESLGPREVHLSERAVALSRLRTEEIVRAGGSQDGAQLRLLGRVDVDESSLQTVTAWVGGRLDRLRVRTTGEVLRRGQVLAAIYSPEIHGAAQELIVAKRQYQRLGEGPGASVAAAALDAARTRLRLLGVPEREVTRFEGLQAPPRNVSIRSPFAGTVVERLASEGSYVQTGEPLYRVADLSRVWVHLDAYERDLPQLQEGLGVSFELDAAPGQRFEGRVDFIDPVVDPRRRTAKVRVALNNPDGILRPGMFVQAQVRASDGPQPLLVPATAPLFTGRRSVVFVETEHPDEGHRYEARTVRLGPRVGDAYPVVAGLSEGDRVVVEGAFALDAELQLRGGQSMMAIEDDRAPAALVVEGLSPEVAGMLGQVFETYLGLQRALAEDDLGASQSAAQRLQGALAAMQPASNTDAAMAWARLGPPLVEATEAMLGAGNSLEALRGPFEPLSEAMAVVLRSLGNPLERQVQIAHCPMAFDNRGAMWVQDNAVVDNAYFGDAMRTCGTLEATIEPGMHLLDGGATVSLEQARQAAEEGAANASMDPTPVASMGSRRTSMGRRSMASMSDHSGHAGHMGHAAPSSSMDHAGHMGHAGHSNHAGHMGHAAHSSSMDHAGHAGHMGHAGHGSHAGMMH